MKCKECGSEFRVSAEQVGTDEKGLPVFHRFGYCDNCFSKVDLDVLASNQQSYKEVKNSKSKKDSPLSIVAAILAIFTCTCIIGGILGIIDLCINDKTKRHLGSWFAIIFCVIWFFVGINSYDKDKTSNNTTINATQQVVVSSEESTKSENSKTEDLETQNYTTGMSFETGDLKITINSADLNYTDYDDEFGWYEPKEGMKYVYVSFTYENIGNSDVYASISDYECYADGSLMEQTFIFDEDFVNANLSPGRNVSFKTFYVVPVDAKEIELEYNKLISLDDEKIIIKLQ